MRLGSRHVFLVPCAENESSQEHVVVRFTGFFFCQIHILFSKVRHLHPDRVDAGLFRSLQDVFFRQRLDAFLRMYPGASDPRRQNPNKFETWGRLCHEIMTFAVAGGNRRLTAQLREYDANRDKVSIALNIIGSGLAFSPESRPQMHLQDDSHPFTLDECFRILSLVGLAARDPVMLCNTGARLRLGREQRPSILVRPRSEDIGSENFGKLHRLPEDFEISIDQNIPHRFVELNMLLLHPRSSNFAIAPEPSPLTHQRANRFLDLCAEHNAFTFSRASSQAIAEIAPFVFQNGKQWIKAVSKQHEIVGHNALPTALDSLVSDDMDALDTTEIESNLQHKYTKIIVDFLSHIANLGPPHNSDIEAGSWQPISVTRLTEAAAGTAETGNAAVDMAMFFVPKAEEIVLGIPPALCSETYHGLSRFWVLRRRASEREAEPDSYPLLGRCRMYAPFSFETGWRDAWHERKVNVFCNDE
jgi:hypothetical protein